MEIPLRNSSIQHVCFVSLNDEGLPSTERIKAMQAIEDDYRSISALKFLARYKRTSKESILSLVNSRFLYFN